MYILIYKPVGPYAHQPSHCFCDVYRYISHMTKDQKVQRSQITSHNLSSIYYIITQQTDRQTLQRILRSTQLIRVSLPQLTVNLLVQETSCSTIDQQLDTRILARMYDFGVLIYVTSQTIDVNVLTNFSFSDMQNADVTSECVAPVLTSSHAITKSDIDILANHFLIQ